MSTHRKLQISDSEWTFCLKLFCTPPFRAIFLLAQKLADSLPKKMRRGTPLQGENRKENLDNVTGLKYKQISSRVTQKVRAGYRAGLFVGANLLAACAA
jgi:hypothetical protein